MKVLAINGGYDGMIDGNFKELHAASVSGIIHRGGTIIKTSRSERFKQKKGREQAFNQLKKAKINGVIVIGGNGSFAGADAFTHEFPIPFIGVPKTIDNDIYGTDFSIGFDTATNTALEAIDKIRDTADSHHRLFFIEVMGRDLGFIALHCGIASGAEIILVPEKKTNIRDLVSKLNTGWKREKSSLIVVVAEGAIEGGILRLAEYIKGKFTKYDIRTIILGHIQRGGNPSCFDRVLASILGNEAVKVLLQGKYNMVVGMKNNKLVYTNFNIASSRKHTINQQLIKIAEELSA
jgi:6-phosphofructokinase 1